MTARQRSSGLALGTVLGCLTAAAMGLGGLWAGPRQAPVRTAQEVRPLAPEPPPAEVAVGPPAVDAAGPGTPCPVDPATPVVAIRVRVPAVVTGGEIEYCICVENCSRAAAHHVLVRNPLPASTRFVRANPEPTSRDPELVWLLGTLAPCACREIRLVLAADGARDVTNCARVQFEHGQCTTTRVERLEPGPPPAVVPAPGPAPRQELSVRKTGPERAVLYDAMTYHVLVTNNTAAEVRDVVITDTLPQGLEHASGKNPLSWELGTLAPGKGKHIEYQVIAKAAGRLCNEVVVTAAGGLRQETSHCVVIGEARLDLAKVAGPERHLVNLPVKYDITVTNPGTEPAANVVVTDTLPSSTTFVSASAGGRAVGNEVQWQLGTLPPGARRTVQVVLQATAAGEVVNRVAASADRGLTAKAEVKTVFAGGSGITLGIVDNDDPVEVGKETSYLVTVLNQGNVPVTKLRVEATVPEQMAIVRAKPAAAGQDGQKLTFEAAALQAGAAVTYRVYVKAQRAGDARLRVDLSADQLPAGPVRREESTTVYTDMPPEAPVPGPGVRERDRP